MKLCSSFHENDDCYCSPSPVSLLFSVNNKIKKCVLLQFHLADVELVRVWVQIDALMTNFSKLLIILFMFSSTWFSQKMIILSPTRFCACPDFVEIADKNFHVLVNSQNPKTFWSTEKADFVQHLNLISLNKETPITELRLFRQNSILGTNCG